MAQDGPVKRTINISQNSPQSTSQEPTIAHLTRAFEEELGAAKKRAEDALNLAKERVAEEFNLLQGRLDEEFNLVMERFFTRINSGIVMDENQRMPTTKCVKLQFKDNVSSEILTGDVIHGEEDRCIQVALVDDNTGEVIEDGPLASARVEIVVLRGEFDGDDDWTAQEFNANIVGEKKPLLRGDVLLKLHRGIATLKNIKFQHHTTKIKPPVFSLGAKVVKTLDGIRIKEAKTESFTVRDFRHKYSSKCETPACTDDVWRLVNICKRGKNHMRLQRMNILTVEDFLLQHLIDPNALKKAVNLGAKKWEATLKHALACPPGRKMYCYTNAQQKRIIVFNLFGKFLRRYPESQCPQSSTLAENHEAEVQELLAPCGYINDVAHFDDETSLHQHVNQYLHVNALESPNPDSLPDVHDSIGTFDMMDTEPSNRSTNAVSAVEAYLVDGMDIDTETQPFPQSLCIDEETLFSPDFIDFLNQPKNLAIQFHDLLYPPGETSNEEQLAEMIAIDSYDPKAINNCEAPTRWRSRLLSTVFFLRKLASIKGSHRPNKMQKVHNCTLG